jgi:hypothetical protein
MKRTTALFLVTLLLLSQALGQSALESNLRKHIQYLASDKLEGRRTGDPGAAAAAKYIESEFKKLKLKTGVRTSYLQPFPYIAGVELGKDNYLQILTDDPRVEKKMELGGNWMPLGYSPNANIPATQIVFAGFGVTAPEANYDNYGNLDVKDKIVLMFDSTPDAGNPHSAFARFNIHTKANIAKDKGAKAIILIAEDNDFKNDRLSKLFYDRSLGETAIPVVGIMRDHGADLLGVKGVEGLSEFEKGLTAQTGTRTVAKVLGTASVTINLTKKTVNPVNVIGILPGNDPILKNEAIIIGAHYDHLGHGGSGSLAANSTDIHHGADDNASGTAAVIELARQFAKEKKNKRTIIFMAFSGEEEGLLGSKYYVENPVWPLDKTVAMINLDMVGRLNENKLTVGGIGTAAEWNESIKRQNDIMFDTGSGYGVGQKFALQLNEDGFGPSDHSSFYSKKIPVLFFFTGTHVDYHKPSDTFDKINYEGLERIVNYVGAIARSVDQHETKPTYAVAKSSAPMGQVRLTVSLGTIPSYGDTTDGMILDGVRDNSPAAKAGLKAGDKITKLAGKDVRNAMDYTYVLGSMKPGEEYEVEIIRGTEKMTLKIVPAAAARRP